MNSSAKKVGSILSPGQSLKRGRASDVSTHATRQSISASSRPGRYTSVQMPLSIIEEESKSQEEISRRHSINQLRTQTKKKKQEPEELREELRTRDRIASYIAYDSNQGHLKSQIREDAQYYISNKDIFTFGSWRTPADIIRQYTDRINNSEIPPTSNRGFLQGICHIYYCFENVVYFINVSPCLRLDRPMEPVRIQIDSSQINGRDSRVTRVIECIIPGGLIRGTSERALVLAHYEAVSFYTYNIDEKGMLQMRDQHLCLQLPGLIISELGFSSNGEVYYVDHNGKLTTIRDRPLKKFLIFNTGRKQLYSEHKQRGVISEFIQKYNRQGLFEGLSLITKKVGHRLKKFFSSSIECSAVQVDMHRRLIFTLTEMLGLSSKTQLIQAYHYNLQGDIECILRMDNKALFQRLQTMGLRIVNEMKEIKHIKTVDECYFAQSNLQILTLNGTRIFLEIKQDFIRPLRIIYPPDLAEYVYQSNSNQRSLVITKKMKISVHPTLCLQLQDAAIRNQQMLTIYRMESGYSAFFASRLSNMMRLSISQVSLNASFGQKQFSQISCYTVSYGKVQEEEVFQRKGNEQTSSILSLGDLARQTYFGPDMYMILTQRFGQFMCKIRPLDILYLLLNNRSIEDCRQKMKEYIALWTRTEIVIMLYIIACDSTSEYYWTPEQARLLTIQIESKKSNVRQSEPLRNSSPKRVAWDDLRPQVKQNAVRLLQEMSQVPEPLKQDEDIKPTLRSAVGLQRQDSSNTKQQAIGIYLSRLLRPLWSKDVSAVGQMNTTLIQKKLEDFSQFLLTHPPNLLKQSTAGPNTYQQLTNFAVRSAQTVHLIRQIRNSLPTMQFSQFVTQAKPYFQKLLFFQLRRYDPSAIPTLMSSFYSLVDNKFSKIAKLFFKLEEASTNIQVIAMCEQFGILPQYVILYVTRVRGISANQLNVQIIQNQKKTSQRKRNMLLNGSPEQRLQLQLDMIDESTQAHLKLWHTNLSIDILQQLIDSREIRRDMKMYYETEKSKLIIRKRYLYVQQFLIKILSKMPSEQSNDIINMLNEQEIQPRILKQLCSRFELTALLTWHLNFPPLSSLDYNTEAEIEKFIMHNIVDWPKNIKQKLRDVLSCVDKAVQNGLLETVVRVVESNNMQMKQQTIKKILEKKENTHIQDLFWLSKLLIAEAFDLQKVEKQYTQALEEALARFQQASSFSEAGLEIAYWLLAKIDLATHLRLPNQLENLRILGQKCIEKLKSKDVVSLSQGLQSILDRTKPMI